MSLEKKEKLFIIIDSNSVIHRAYHALPRLTTKKGELVNAVYGFLLVFLKAIKEFNPDFIAAAFDLPAPTFRHKKYKEYKAKRPPMPEDLGLQIGIVKDILAAFNVSIFEKEGFEADDVIGTLANLSSKGKIKNIILSGDLDTLQLVDSYTKVYALRKGVKDTILYDTETVKEKYNLTPEQLVDFKALKGDPSDNILGVSGVGEKTAQNIIKEFGGLESLYKELEQKSEKAEKIKSKLKEMLIRNKEQAFFSKDLVEIDKNVPLDFDFNKVCWQNYNKQKAAQILEKLEFYSLIKRLPLPEKLNEVCGTQKLPLW